ncbi:MAG: aromatic ring-hydroxylating dioxygenase subunit alpha [Acidimicrobiales bacterium]
MGGVIESEYVIDDRDTPRFRVRRLTMVDPDILERERRLIFDRSWLFVGHESELSEPHEFRTRKVGGRPIIFTRHTDGSVNVFLNTCPHRGMQIETRPEGKGRFLKCFYHGWSFNTEGTLVALPDEDSYGETFDRHNLCLARPPKVDSYRGFVFLSWTDEIESLDAYLGGATDILDLFADQSDEGMRIIGGTHLYAAKANWKLLSENSYDGYHADHTPSLPRHAQGVGQGPVEGVRRSRRGPSLGWDLGNGHAVIGGTDGTSGQNTGLGRDLATKEALDAQVARRNHFADKYGESVGQPDVLGPQSRAVPEPGDHRSHHGHHAPHLLPGEPRLHGDHGVEPATLRRRAGAAEHAPGELPDLLGTRRSGDPRRHRGSGTLSKASPPTNTLPGATSPGG